MSKRLTELLESRYMPEPNSGCWLWLGTLTLVGYARFHTTGNTIAVHRAFYEEAKGPIPHGLVLDHLCRVRSCVNPDHLEAVSNRENLLRGETLAAAIALKTHCNSGHPLSGDNLHLRRDRPARGCRICRREAATRYRTLSMEATP